MVFARPINFFKIHFQLDAILRKEGSYKKTKEKSCTIAKVQENIFFIENDIFSNYLIWKTGSKFSPLLALFDMGHGARVELLYTSTLSLY